MKTRNLFLMTTVCLALASCTQELKQIYNTAIPTEGNSWTQASPQGTVQTNTYFYTATSDSLEVGLKVRGIGQLTASLNGVSTNIRVNSTSMDTLFLGKFPVQKAGYQILQLQMKSQQDSIHISDVLVNAPDQDSINFVRASVYFGKRGPSVHLKYEIPSQAGDAEWFYNEVCIPEGNDVIGSYFMANGFSEGYFGMQVNAADERRILFSVWSPFKTDDPKAIPEDHKILLLGKNPNVHTGEFGDEGSGGQSYLKYLWKAGVTYRFLLHIHPAPKGYTNYTAYFFAPEGNQWQWIATFSRPLTTTYVKHPHSFLENFIPEAGEQTREGYYGNQWICNTKGKWFEMTKAYFTADATARAKDRFDYTGGSESNRFYLKNCGFFNPSTPYNVTFERRPNGVAPVVDLKSLLKLAK